jgi:short-subunit dehydrogenase
VAHLAQQAISKFGRVDVWVNNAGSGAVGRFQEIPLEEHVKVVETDLLGTLYGSYYAMRHFRQRNCGILINISSVIGKVPSPYFSSYAAAKHGVIGLSTSIRQELEEDKIDNIHVCVVMPTSFDTPFFEHAATHTGHEVEPIPPVYDPDEVVNTIVRLASDPEPEVTVGRMAKLTTMAHQLMPRQTESHMASQTRKAEFEKPKPAQPSSGAVLEPQPTGTEVRGGWKK